MVVSGMLRKFTLIFLVLFWATMSTPAAAQTYVKSPEVHDDGKVTFRFYAPKAEEVVLSAGENSGAMIKSAEGIWEKTIGPLSPGTYAYRFTVDGAAVLDPVNRQTKAWLWMENLVNVDVRGQAAAQHQVQNVPHGELHIQRYHSKQLDQSRQFYVYTPPGYAASEKEYPVLYLLHGFGDDESAWARVGMANNILDNVWAQSDASPFIVVMPFGHDTFPATPDYQAYDLEGNALRMETELLENIKPMVESRYRCLEDPKSRGIAGLSMGGGQSVRIGLSHTDLFGWVTGYSASIKKLGCVAALENHLDAIKKDQPKLSLVCGKTDFLFDENVEYEKKLSELNIDHHHYWSQGGHTWDNWRSYLAETAQTMFSE